jgi:hypothetical protein
LALAKVPTYAEKEVRPDGNLLQPVLGGGHSLGGSGRLVEHANGQPDIVDVFAAHHLRDHVDNLCLGVFLSTGSVAKAAAWDIDVG